MVRKKPKRGEGGTLLIACGALAREITALMEINRWEAFTVTCLPAIWHNTPEKIPEGVRAKIHEGRDKYDRMLVLYGDCGTGGLLDKVLEEEGVQRIDGPHCYSFFSGNDVFADRHADDIATFFLTDYLARHFDHLVWQGLGLDHHPELLPMYFGNYDKLVYLAQIEDPELDQMARAAADKLGLRYEFRMTGYGDLARYMEDGAAASRGGD